MVAVSFSEEQLLKEVAEPVYGHIRNINDALLHFFQASNNAESEELTPEQSSALEEVNSAYFDMHNFTQQRRQELGEGYEGPEPEAKPRLSPELLDRPALDSMYDDIDTTSNILANNPTAKDFSNGLSSGRVGAEISNQESQRLSQLGATTGQAFINTTIEVLQTYYEESRKNYEVTMDSEAANVSADLQDNPAAPEPASTAKASPSPFRNILKPRPPGS